MLAIKTVGIFSKPGVAQAVELLPRVMAWLAARGIAVRCDAETGAYLAVAHAAEASGEAAATPLVCASRDDVAEGCQFVIVLGGDGTLLAAARAIGSRQVPLFGVNLGSLGFLTAITVDELFPELERALRGEHRIGHRSMLDCAIIREGAEASRYLALNDAVVSKSALAGMIELDVIIGGNLVCTYKSDGLIVSTPTGSTAYSLSAGGPIVLPTVGAFAITPICPHMLTNRPVIVPESAVIEIVSHAREGAAWLSIDGQVGEAIEKGDRVVCRRSPHTLELIRPPRLLYFDVLRDKLKWGER